MHALCSVFVCKKIFFDNNFFMSLKEYNEKRNFNKTTEPKGRCGKKKHMFVVQLHRASRLHYDFRLEHDGVLLSWAVPKGPSFNPKDKRLAVMVENHPVSYGDFEGIIPEGEYGAGEVIIWDTGIYSPKEDFKKGLKDGNLKFELFGKRLKGCWTLVRIKGEKNWLLIKEKDEFQKSTSGITKFKTSVKTGRTLAGVRLKEKDIPFQKADVCLAKITESVPKGKNWLFEVKYDGYRAVAYVSGGQCRILSRNGKDFSSKFKDIALSLCKLGDGQSFVVDGEIIVTDSEGRSDFQALQNFLRSGGKQPSYIVFDILSQGGDDLRGLSLLERKKRLKRLLSGADGNIAYSKHVRGKGEECFLLSKELGLEGIVGKRVDSPYISGKNDNWVKIKCYKRQEFIVAGFSKSDKKFGLSAILLGVYSGDKLKYVGRAGTGFTEKSGIELEKLFCKNIVLKCPFENMPKVNEKVIWVKPKFVAEVQFSEFTKDGMLRQASFKGIRDDKLAKDVIVEMPEPEVCGVKISNADRIIFPDEEITKLDIAKYYEAVSGRMLPFVEGRVMSVVRCHDGISGECFFKKHPQANIDGVKNVMLDGEEYFAIQSARGLISEAQFGTIEFHPWASELKKLEKPNIMVFDLDPDKSLGLDKVREGALDLKKTLQKLGLKSFLKTSGGKGYHIVVPLNPGVSWETLRNFAEKVALLEEAEHPDKYTTNVRKQERRNKIFIDWMRNGRGATSVAPYSLRARKGASVSMPISWRELFLVAPDGIKLGDALERLKRVDPWRSFFSIRQTIARKEER